MSQRSWCHFSLFGLSAASHRGVNQALGVHQWFCLLQRPSFSTFDDIYQCVRAELADEPVLQLGDLNLFFFGGMNERQSCKLSVTPGDRKTSNSFLVVFHHVSQVMTTE